MTSNPQSPVVGLARESDGAGLIVVGSHGHGGFLGLRLGSTGDGLIRHSGTKVVVPAETVAA